MLEQYYYYCYYYYRDYNNYLHNPSQIKVLKRKRPKNVSNKRVPESSCAFFSSQGWTGPRTPVKKAPIRVIFLSALSAATVEARPTSAPAFQAS